MKLQWLAKRRIVIYGSLAYDRVMDFHGYFKDNFMRHKLHVINLSFMVDKVTDNFGGTGGNISYSLGLMGFRPQLLAIAGNDFGLYGSWLKKHQVDIGLIKLNQKQPTASAYIITDKDDNQITGFSAGAMKTGYQKIPLIKSGSLVIVAPGNVNDMKSISLYCQKKKIPFIFDPGQQVSTYTGRDLLLSVKGCELLIGNDYEISLIAHKLGISEIRLKSISKILVKTLGLNGSEMHFNNRTIKLKAVVPKKVVDPTGAGDAYRAGLIAGLVRGFDLEKSGRLASLTASYAVQKYGTQNHRFSWNKLNHSLI